MGATQGSNRDRNRPGDSVIERALRRAVEFVGSLFASREMKRLVRRLASRVQHSLGATNNPGGATALVRVRANAAAVHRRENQGAAFQRDPFGR